MDKLSEVIMTNRDGVMTLAMNRPEKRNAMTTVMLAELIYSLEAAATDSAVRVVVLRGADKGFCPGDDLGGMGELPTDFQYRLQHAVTHPALQDCLRALPKPTIAAIHGFAFGVGMDIAMACDFRIATDDAQIRDQRVIERGMHAVTGSAWFQPRAIGITRAMEYLILGKAYSGKEAADIGMVTQSVPADAFEAAIAAMAAKLAVAPTKAIGLMKRQIYHGLTLDHREFHEFASPLLHEVEIKDRREGINAFLEKRPARFTGE